jgi:hypothetical protein
MLAGTLLTRVRSRAMLAGTLPTRQVNERFGGIRGQSELSFESLETEFLHQVLGVSTPLPR